MAAVATSAVAAQTVQRCRQPIQSRDEVEKTPSFRAGMSTQQEAERRLEGCGLIWDLGGRLRMPLRSLATACVYFHMFFVRHSHVKYLSKDVAIACLFLAGKVENTPRRVVDVVRCVLRAADSEPESEAMVKVREQILEMEAVLLNAIDYAFTVPHPFEFVPAVVRRTFRASRLPDGTLKTVAFDAWVICVDSLRSPVLCLTYTPQSLAVVSVIIACVHRRVPFPDRWFVELIPGFESVKLLQGAIDEVLTLVTNEITREVAGSDGREALQSLFQTGRVVYR